MFFFNVGVCTALIRVLYCIVYALRTACTVVIFFVSVFLLSVNLFSQCMGVHCFVNHTCTSLIMVLCCTFVYFHTVLNYFTCFAFFYLCFCSYVFLFSNLCSCTALLGMLRLHSTNSVYCIRAQLALHASCLHSVRQFHHQQAKLNRKQTNIIRVHHYRRLCMASKLGSAHKQTNDT